MFHFYVCSLCILCVERRAYSIRRGNQKQSIAVRGGIKWGVKRRSCRKQQQHRSSGVWLWSIDRWAETVGERSSTRKCRRSSRLCRNLRSPTAVVQNCSATAHGVTIVYRRVLSVFMCSTRDWNCCSKSGGRKIVFLKCLEGKFLYRESERRNSTRSVYTYSMSL